MVALKYLNRMIFGNDYIFRFETKKSEKIILILDVS
jgi:hypothetical protein